jgi:hypothetical protein
MHDSHFSRSLRKSLIRSSQSYSQINLHIRQGQSKSFATISLLEFPKPVRVLVIYWSSAFTQSLTKDNLITLSTTTLLHCLFRVFCFQVSKQRTFLPFSKYRVKSLPLSTTAGPFSTCRLSTSLKNIPFKSPSFSASSPASPELGTREQENRFRRCIN